MIPERYERIRRVLDRRQPDLTVLMERVHKSHNFSAILRSCDAVGVLETHVVPPEGGLPTHQSSSAGSEKWVGVNHHLDLATAVGWLHERDHQVVAAHPDPEAVDFRDVDFTRPTAVLMGAELHGLSEEALTLADRNMVIPMEGMVRSLNVSVATALILFEAHRQRDAAGMYDGPRLDDERRARLLFEWGYPRVARRYRERGEPYPDLDERGQIVRD